MTSALDGGGWSTSRPICQTIDTLYLKLVTWNLPDSHTTTPRKTTGNPKGECGGCTKSYTLGAGYIADCNTLQQVVQSGSLFHQGWFLGGTRVELLSGFNKPAF
jgi:hypothetical protein